MLFEFLLKWVWFIVILILHLIAPSASNWIAGEYMNIHFWNLPLDTIPQYYFYCVYTFIFLFSLAFPSKELSELLMDKVDKHNGNSIYDTLIGICHKSSFASLAVFILLAVFKIGSHWDVLLNVFSLWIVVTFFIPALFHLCLCSLSWIPRHTDINIVTFVICESAFFCLIAAIFLLATVFNGSSNIAIRILLISGGIIGLATHQMVIRFASKEIARNFVVYNKTR